MTMSRRRCVSTLIAAGLSPCALSASAQDTAGKPIRLIVPYPPGGGTDVVARAVSRRLTENMGRQVIVDNRPGASTIIGTDMVAKAAADGLTLGLVTDSHPINFSFNRKLPYQAGDFTPIIQLLQVPLALLVNANLPVRTFDELLAFARTTPGKLTFGSAGSGSPHELAMLWLNKVAGVAIRVIQYKGVAPAIVDVLSGQIDMLFTGTGVATEHLKAGKLRAIAVTSPQRKADLPNVQAIAERFPDYAVNTWYGIVAPAGLSPELVRHLNAEFAKALQADDVRNQIVAGGAEVVGGSAADLRRLLQNETQLWTRVIQLTGAKPE